MELAIITAKQVVILYCLILAGFAGVKSGVIKQEAKKAFSNLLRFHLAVPAMVIHSDSPQAAAPCLPDCRRRLCSACGVSGRTCDYYVMYLPDEREGASDPAVCLDFQCGIYAFWFIEALFGAEGSDRMSVYVMVFRHSANGPWDLRHDYRNGETERGRPHSLPESGADCRGDRTGDLPVPDSGAGGD